MTTKVDADAAWKWIAYTLQPDNVTTIANGTTAIPALKSVLATDPRFGPGGSMAVIGEALSGGYSIPRPPHPGYTTMSVAFAQAIQDIEDGLDVKTALDKAVKTIDDDLKANDYYPVP